MISQGASQVNEPEVNPGPLLRAHAPVDLVPLGPEGIRENTVRAARSYPEADGAEITALNQIARRLTSSTASAASALGQRTGYLSEVFLLAT